MRNDRKSLFIYIACAVLVISVCCLPALAVIQYVEPFNALNVTSMQLQNNSTGTQQTNNELTVETPEYNNWTYGNTRIYGSFDIDPSSSYTGRLICVPIDQSYFQFTYYKIIVNMWLYVSYTDGTPQLTLNQKNNIIYAIHPDNTTSGSIAEYKTINENNADFINYHYEITLDQPVSQLWFNFSFDTAAVEQNQQIITFYGNLQIDNLTNQQIDDLESTIIGDPNRHPPEGAEEADSAIQDYNDIFQEYNQDFQEQINQMNEQYTIKIGQILPAMSFISNISTFILNNEKIAILITISLTIGVILFLLRLRK